MANRSNSGSIHRHFTKSPWTPNEESVESLRGNCESSITNLSNKRLGNRWNSSSLQLRLATWETMVFFVTMMASLQGNRFVGRQQIIHSTNVPRPAQQFTGIRNRIPRNLSDLCKLLVTCTYIQ